MFKSTKARLGPIGETEVYGFKTPLIEGGAWSVDNIAILPIIDYLLALRRVAEPRFPLGF
jgi:hypothetical protein